MTEAILDSISVPVPKTIPKSAGGFMKLLERLPKEFLDKVLKGVGFSWGILGIIVGFLLSGVAINLLLKRFNYSIGDLVKGVRGEYSF